MLSGKAALVTGSTSGIGLQILKTLAGAGCNVAMHGFGDPAFLQDMCGELSAAHKVDTTLSLADLRKPAQIRDMVQSVQAQFGRLDILVSNDPRRHPDTIGCAQLCPSQYLVTRHICMVNPQPPHHAGEQCRHPVREPCRGFS